MGPDFMNKDRAGQPVLQAIGKGAGSDFPDSAQVLIRVYPTGVKTCGPYILTISN